MTSGAASIKYRCPLCGTNAATFPMTGAWVGSQNSACTLSGGAAVTWSTSIPSYTTAVRSSGTPSLTSIDRIIDEAQIKQSICRYFHREKAFFLM